MGFGSSGSGSREPVKTVAKPRRARNTNRQGAGFELMIMRDLTRYGYIAHRSSGSRGAVDVVAVGAETTLWIQAKITATVIPPEERRSVIDLAERVGASAIPMSAYRDRGVVRYRFLTGYGPADWLPWEPEPLRFALCGHTACAHTMGWHDAHGCWSAADTAACACPGFRLAN
jgi:hypothetical protein